MQKSKTISRGFGCLLVLLLATGAQALHIKGGWMSYKFLGKDGAGNFQYEVTVKVYRDCGVQSPGQNDNIVNISVFSNATNTKAAPVFVAGQVNNYTLRKSSFSPCISPRPDVCYVILEYRGTITVAPLAQGYTLAFQRCCRIDGIVNVVPPSNNLGNTYSIQLPGNQWGDQFMENSSPIFAEKDTAVVCYNNTLTLDYSAMDPDGDSLVYEFGPALSGASSGEPVPVEASPPPFTNVSYGQGYSAENPFGTFMALDSKTGIITGPTPSGTGEYVVAVVVKEYRNGRFLASTRKELHVNVANCSMPEAELPKELVNCDNFVVKFENQSASPIINSYYWDLGSPGTPGNITDLVKPEITYPDTGTYTAKLVVNRGQACSDSTTMVVKVFPGFNPGFLADGSCFSNPFLFKDTTSARYGTTNSWRWDFGNTNATNDTSRLKNPVYTYPSPGTYNVQLKVTSTKGCDKTVELPLQVLDKPALSLPFRDTLICSIDTLQLQAIGTGVFSWTPSTGRIIGAGTATPLVFPLTTTKYIVNLNDRGCQTSDTVRVNVLDLITVNAGNDTTICRGDTIMLRPTTPGLGFSWSPATLLDNPNARNPLTSPLAATTKYVVVANLGKCRATDSVVVRTVPYPTAMASNDTSICFGSTISLTGILSGSSVQWVDANNLPFSNSPTISVTPSQSTFYTFRVFENRGCPKPGIKQVYVNVKPQIVVDAGRDTSITLGQPMVLKSTSNAEFNKWTPATGLSADTGLNPTLQLSNPDIPAGTQYITYKLTGTTPEGCTDSDEITIRVFSTGPSIFVPTAFTPNRDGLNDNIRPIIVGMKYMDYFRVFNRYGQLVFESKNPEAYWDGTFKGQLQNSGTFVYQVQAVDYNDQMVKQHGTFVLIR